MSITRFLKTKKRIFIFLCACVALFGLHMLYTFVQPTNKSDNADKSKQQEMLEIILDCGELAPIPKSARIKTISTEGNMFTRSFRLTFAADTKTINDWLQMSKGVQTAKLVDTGSIRQYILNVKCDYEYGDVRVDYGNRQVVVYISKS